MSASLNIFDRSLARNPRFYILLTSVLLAAGIAVLVPQFIGEPRLALIRTEQTFAFMSLGFLYAALMITPLTKAFPQMRVAPYLLHARRAIGVSAFLFGSLHMVLSFRQLGGLSGLSFLSPFFLVALVLGLIALSILFLMALTSFDWAIEKMGFTNWKRLHRFIYVAGWAVLAHILIIGSHLGSLYSWSFLAIMALLLPLFLLEAIRLHTTISDPALRLGTLGPLTFAVMVVATLFSSSLIYAGYLYTTVPPGQISREDHSGHLLFWRQHTHED